MRTLGRLLRLERLAEREGCPHCPPVMLVGPDDPEPGPCAFCGREPDVILLEEVVVGPEAG
jgi:hypothetical protein